MWSITAWQIVGEKVEAVADFTFLGSKITAESDCSHETTRCFFCGKKDRRNLDSIVKSRGIHHSPNKGLYSQSYGFSSSRVSCESWTIKKAECQRLDAFELWLEKALESPLDSKEIQPVHPKGDQPRIFIGMTHAEAEAPVLWPLNAKS